MIRTPDHNPRRENAETRTSEHIAGVMGAGINAREGDGSGNREKHDGSSAIKPGADGGHREAIGGVTRRHGARFALADQQSGIRDHVGRARPANGMFQWGDQQRFAEDHHRDGEEEAGAEARRATPEQEGGADDDGKQHQLGVAEHGHQQIEGGIGQGLVDPTEQHQIDGLQPEHQKCGGGELNRSLIDHE